MHTDHAQLDDQQREAVEYLLEAAPDCGLHRLRVEELVNLCERFGAALDGAERQAYNEGWYAAFDYQAAAAESRQLKRAHA